MILSQYILKFTVKIKFYWIVAIATLLKTSHAKVYLQIGGLIYKENQKSAFISIYIYIGCARWEVYFENRLWKTAKGLFFFCFQNLLADSEQGAQSPKLVATQEAGSGSDSETKARLSHKMSPTSLWDDDDDDDEG